MDKSFKRDENGCITLLNGAGIYFDNETGRRKKYEKLAEYEGTELTPDEINEAYKAMRSALALACEVQSYRNKLERGELVEVVRCGDCIHYWLPQHKCLNSFSGYAEYERCGTDFCDKGERSVENV